MGVESGWLGYDEEFTLISPGDTLTVTANQNIKAENSGTTSPNRQLNFNPENLIVDSKSQDPLLVRINPHTAQNADGSTVTYTNELTTDADEMIERRDRPIHRVEVVATEQNQRFRISVW